MGVTWETKKQAKNPSCMCFVRVQASISCLFHIVQCWASTACSCTEVQAYCLPCKSCHFLPDARSMQHTRILARSIQRMRYTHTPRRTRIHRRQSLQPQCCKHILTVHTGLQKVVPQGRRPCLSASMTQCISSRNDTITQQQLLLTAKDAAACCQLLWARLASAAAQGSLLLQMPQELVRCVACSMLQDQQMLHLLERELTRSFIAVHAVQSGSLLAAVL